MKVGSPLSGALDSPEGNGFRIGLGASRSEPLHRRRGGWNSKPPSSELPWVTRGSLPLNRTKSPRRKCCDEKPRKSLESTCVAAGNRRSRRRTMTTSRRRGPPIECLRAIRFTLNILVCQSRDCRCSRTINEPEESSALDESGRFVIVSRGAVGKCESFSIVIHIDIARKLPSKKKVQKAPNSAALSRMRRSYNNSKQKREKP